MSGSNIPLPRVRTCTKTPSAVLPQILQRWRWLPIVVTDIATLAAVLLEEAHSLAYAGLHVGGFSNRNGIGLRLYEVVGVGLIALNARMNDTYQETGTLRLNAWR